MERLTHLDEKKEPIRKELDIARRKGKEEKIWALKQKLKVATDDEEKRRIEYEIEDVLETKEAKKRHFCTSKKVLEAMKHNEELREKVKKVCE